MARILGAILISIAFGYAQLTASPTQGFNEVKLTEANFKIQKPYDKDVSQRYSYVNGVHSMWVYNKDKPFKPDSKTNPRTEIRISFEGEVYVPRATTGVSVMQVFGGAEHATACMLHVYDGNLKRYNEQVVASDIYDRWIHVNVIHNADEGKVYVFVEEKEKVEARDSGHANHYFKFGVYAQNNSSSCMESRWRNIKIWNKSFDPVKLVDREHAFLCAKISAITVPSEV